MRILTNYFTIIKQNLALIHGVNLKGMFSYFENLFNDTESDQTITSENYSYGFIGSKFQVCLFLENLAENIRKTTQEVENLEALIKPYYSGFACTVCDVEGH